MTTSIPTARTIEHADCPTDVWFDDCPESPAVGLEVNFPGKVYDEPIYIPIDIAREVAQAILDTIPE